MTWLVRAQWHMPALAKGPKDPRDELGSGVKALGFPGRGPSAVGSRPPLAEAGIMIERIVILGGGTAGTLAANRLRREFPHNMKITVVDRDDRHVYQPGLLFVPFGRARPQSIVRSRPRQLRRGVDYHESAVDHVDIDGRLVYLGDGTVLPYEVLVVATGAALLPCAMASLRPSVSPGNSAAPVATTSTS